LFHRLNRQYLQNEQLPLSEITEQKKKTMTLEISGPELGEAQKLGWVRPSKL